MNSDLSELLANGLPSFSGVRLDPFSRAALSDGVQYGEYVRNASVDLAQVRGVEHPDYQGKTWLELLGNPPGSSGSQLKRIQSVLNDLRRNPSYYSSHDPKDHWSFYQLGDNLFVAEGVHRTVVARFLLEANGMPAIVHGVGLTVLHPVANQLPTQKLKGWFQRFFGHHEALYLPNASSEVTGKSE